MCPPHFGVNRLGTGCAILHGLRYGSTVLAYTHAVLRSILIRPGEFFHRRPTVRFINNDEQVGPEQWSEYLRRCHCPEEDIIMISSPPPPLRATDQQPQQRSHTQPPGCMPYTWLETIPLGTSSAPWEQYQKRALGKSAVNSSWGTVP